jgi:hypothetical protein
LANDDLVEGDALICNGKELEPQTQVSKFKFGEGELLVVVTLGDHAEEEAVEEVSS